MRTLKEKFATWGAGTIDGKEATRLANEIWGLGEAEGYWSECVSPHPNSCPATDSRTARRGQLAADAAHVSAAHSECVFSPLGLDYY